jgi:hypothetical protein
MRSFSRGPAADTFFFVRWSKAVTRSSALTELEEICANICSAPRSLNTTRGALPDEKGVERMRRWGAAAGGVLVGREGGYEEEEKARLDERDAMISELKVVDHGGPSLMLRHLSDEVPSALLQALLRVIIAWMDLAILLDRV